MWLPGFFTGRRHAVIDLARRMDFHGLPVGWSVCDRPVLLKLNLAEVSVSTPGCPRCERWLRQH